MDKQKTILFLFITVCINILTVNSSLFSQEKEDIELKKTYTIGYMKNIFYNVDVNDVKAAIKVWVDESLKHYEASKGYYFVNKFYENFNDLNEGISKDNVAIVSMSTLDYLNQSGKIGLEAALVPEIDGEIGVEYCLLVRKESHYNSLKDLKSKSIGLMSTPIFISSSLWLDVLLSKNNLMPGKKFFNKIESAPKETQLVLNLFFRNLDACIVTKTAFRLMKELNPQIDQQLISIYNSPSYVAGLICYPKSNQNKEVREGFYNSLLELHKLNVGRQIFTLLKINKLVPAKDEYFDSFVNLLKDHKKIAK